MSPFWGMAVPDFETRATTTTVAWPDSLASGDIAMLSSRLKV
jgi:hypothetical protein